MLRVASLTVSIFSESYVVFSNRYLFEVSASEDKPLFVSANNTEVALTVTSSGMTLRISSRTSSVLSCTLVQKGNKGLSAHLLFVGGEDHNLRIPFMLALRAKGYCVSAAASGDPEPFSRAGIEHRQFYFNRFMDPRADWRTLQSLRDLLEDVGADIAHCFDTKLGLLVPFAAHSNRRTHIVPTINGRGWLYSSRSLGALALRASYRPLQRLAASSTGATIFEHHGDQSFFERNHLLGKGEAIVIPGAGIDVEGFELARVRGASPKRLRQELGLNDAEVIITVTRVTRQKGILTLLKAAALVHEARPSARFLIVGPRESEGPFGVTEAELQEHADYVIATGPRPDVASLLAMADLFAFPSEYAEGLPRALMEAALCGLPIVASDLAGCREIIRDGWNGYLVPVRQPRALANRILHALENREESACLAERGPDLVRREFSLDKVVERHAELYERQLLLTRE